MNIIKLIIAISVIMFFTLTNAFAVLKYNTYTGQWENVGNDYEQKYNPYTGSNSYQKPDAQLEYNPYTGKWEYER